MGFVVHEYDDTAPVNALQLGNFVVGVDEGVQQVEGPFRIRQVDVIIILIHAAKAVERRRSISFTGLSHVESPIPPRAVVIPERGSLQRRQVDALGRDQRVARQPDNASVPVKADDGVARPLRPRLEGIRAQFNIFTTGRLLPDGDAVGVAHNLHGSVGQAVNPFGALLFGVA